MTARAFDKQGDPATFNLHGNSIPYAEWLRGKLPTLPSLAGLPLKMSLIVPTRDLKTFPAVLRTRGWSGSVGGRIDIDGSFKRPRSTWRC